jgi:hypothetical protein
VNPGRGNTIALLFALQGPIALAGCRSDLHVVKGYMTGSFSSTRQHLADPDNYYDIRLHMVPVWEQCPDGPWLYVEQASAEGPQRPYRQRVYRLRANSDGTLESVVYELPGDPLRFAGAWREPARLEALAPRDLVRREGCSIMIRKNPDGMFVGSTSGKGCRSKLRGASYATSEVVIGPDRLTSWDRGFDAEDRQVWGAIEGAYIFIKDRTSGPSG